MTLKLRLPLLQPFLPVLKLLKGLEYSGLQPFSGLFRSLLQGFPGFLQPCPGMNGGGRQLFRDGIGNLVEILCHSLKLSQLPPNPHNGYQGHNKVTEEGSPRTPMMIHPKTWGIMLTKPRIGGWISRTVNVTASPHIRENSRQM